MIDQDFLKTLTILYIEDDETIRDSFLEILEKLFSKVVVAEDGLSALNEFKDSRESGSETFDAIVCDINLPKLNGIDLLEEIRKYDENIPFMFTTAHFESEYLLKAIKLGVSEYFIKPLDAKEVISHIQKVCEKRHQESRIIHYQQEIKKYLEVIDQVAIVSRINIKNKYKFVNEFFCEVSGYKEDEIVGQPTLLMKPDDVAESLYDEMWKELNSGKIWRGKLKRKSKDGDAFFVTSTIFPIFDEEDKNKIEYISIEFQTTEEETQKREFKKKVIYNLQETRRINTVARKKIDDLLEQVKNLEEQLRSYKHYDVLQDKLKMEIERNVKLNSQIKYYEGQVKDSKQRYEKVSDEITDRIFKAESSTSEIKRKNKSAMQQIEFLKSELTTTEKHRDKLNELVDKQIKTITNLEEVIEHREEELKQMRE